MKVMAAAKDAVSQADLASCAYSQSLLIAIRLPVRHGGVSDLVPDVFRGVVSALHATCSVRSTKPAKGTCQPQFGGASVFEFL